MTLLKFCVSATVVAATLVAAVPRAHGQYMSMFNASNMAAVNIAGTISVNSAVGRSAKISSATSNAAGSDEVAPRANQPYQAIVYSVDPAVRAEVINTYIDRAREIDAAEGEELAQLFRDRDLIGETAQNLTAYGLDINDLGDVITAYWAVNWGAVHQSGRPSVAQVQGLREQFRTVLAGSQLTATTTVAERQKIADDMLIRLILIDGGVEQGLRENNAAQLQAISEYVHQSSLSTMDIDLAALDLTAEGLNAR
ncbi:MAG: DUF6683 family protein [Cyanobacteria bacterium J06553_1]